MMVADYKYCTGDLVEASEKQAGNNGRYQT